MNTVPARRSTARRCAVLLAGAIALVAAFVIHAAAPAAAPVETTKQPLLEAPPSGLDSAADLPGRPEGSRVAEPARFELLQRRIDARQREPEAGCPAVYAAHKAQAWLNFARYGFHSGQPASMQERTYAAATGILEELEAHAEPALGTSELPGARHVRDDLWKGAAEVKRDGRVCAAPKLAAFCEVELAWAGYEASVGGWRHVEPYIRIAEDYCAQAAAAQVPPPPPEPPAAPVEAPPVTRAPAGMPVFERFELSASVLFPHDRSSRADMRPDGRAELHRLAVHIKGLAELTSVTVVGHADVTGTAAHNLALSQRRAATVAAELAGSGVDSAKITAVGVGSSEPVVSCKASLKRRHRTRYLTCLEPNRRVTIELAGTAAREAPAGDAP